MATGASTRLLAMTGLDQVAPPSAERMSATLNVFGLTPFWKLTIRSKPSISMLLAGPAVGTTTWLPIVWFSWPGSKMTRPGLQVTPPSLVFENTAGPRNASEKVKALGLAFLFGETRRSHTA